MSINRERRQTRSLTATNSTTNNDNLVNSKLQKQILKTEECTNETSNSNLKQAPSDYPHIPTRTSQRRSNHNNNNNNSNTIHSINNKPQNSIVKENDLKSNPNLNSNIKSDTLTILNNKKNNHVKQHNLNSSTSDKNVNSYVNLSEQNSNSSSTSPVKSSVSSANLYESTTTIVSVNSLNSNTNLNELTTLTSQKINTRRRSNHLINQLRSSNGLSSSFSSSSSCLLDQALPNRKRNLSSSLDLSKNENQLNIENLNSDRYNQAQASSSASSSSSSFHNLNKRLKLKHKYAFKELSINENNLQTNFRLLSKDEFDNSSINESKNDLIEEKNEESEEQNEHLSCPVEGCSSEGHLDGLLEHHYTFDTCPVYFEMTKEECTKRRLDLNKRMNEIKEKLNRINESKKNLRNKMISKEQLEYYEKVNKDLKNIVKTTDTITNRKKIKEYIFSNNPDLLGDIKNLTTSFIINSLSNYLTPTPMPIYHHHSTNANTNFLNNLNHTKAQPPSINDLNISSYELNIFKDVLTQSTKEIVPTQYKFDSNTVNLKKLKLVNKSNKIIQFGNYEIETWYKSPYPDDIWQLNKIFICQYCLIYMKSYSVLNRHLEKCLWRHPPGREIYRKDKLSFFEVDGKFNKIYCQNLCLLAKLFLDHKTLYYDVEPFLFYILTQYSEETGSFQMVGYFSKEKQSVMNYNLSCILILPQFMNKGYGRVLIDFSYLLSRVEGKIGSPERPLSDLGLISYRSYWKSKLLLYLAKHMDECEISVKEISAETGILTNDLISTLQYIGLIKYWKGKHVILKDKELIDKYLEKKSLYSLDVDQSCLKWTPYVYQTIINESDTPAHPISASSVKGNKLTNYTSS